MSFLQEQIKKGIIRPAYLIYGNEPFLMDLDVKWIRDALIRSGDEMNLNVFDGDSLNIADLLALADTMPFFSEHRLLIVRESGLFRRGGDTVESWLSDHSEHTQTVIVFVERDENVDKRSKLYKRVQSCGVIVEETKLDRPRLERWIVRGLEREGLKIELAALQLMIDRIGSDMYSLRNEVNKLAAYRQGEEAIRLEDVKKLLPELPDDNIYNMLDAAIMHQPDQALQYYHELVQKQIKTVDILRAMQRLLARLLLICDMREQGFDRASISEASGRKDWQIKKDLALISGLSKPQIQRLLDASVEAEIRPRTGNGSDADIELDLLVARIAGGFSS